MELKWGANELLGTKQVHFLLRAYFLAAQTYKRMRLITQVYGITVCINCLILLHKLAYGEG